MIFDGESRFPNSCVMFTKFESYSLKQMFAYLREKEMYLQEDVKRFRGTHKEIEVRARLEEVEAHLIWMAHNCK